MDTLPTHTAPPRASSRLSTPFVALAALAALALLTFRAAPAEIEEATARRFEAIKAWRAGDKEGAKVSQFTPIAPSVLAAFTLLPLGPQKIAGDKASSAKQAVVDAKAEYDEFQEWKKTHPRPAEKVGWMPFAQAGAETGGNFMAQGLDLNALTNDGPAPPEEKAHIVYGRPSKFKNIGHAAPVGAASRPCGRYAPQGSPCLASVETDDKLTGGRGDSHEAAVRKKADEQGFPLDGI